VVQGKAFTEMNEKLISKTLTINTEAHLWLIRDVIDAMIKRNHGHIVSINSIAGLAGNPGMVDYCASKFGAYGLNEALRLEMKSLGHNIRFTTVCPFAFNSGMFKGV
jgi:all-trans-retinol dehydrogenase (NAD+)